jgi:hypothetical protein
MGTEEIALDFIRVYRRIKEKSFRKKETKTDGHSLSGKGNRRGRKNKISQDNHTS